MTKLLGGILMGIGIIVACTIGLAGGLCMAMVSTPASPVTKWQLFVFMVQVGAWPFGLGVAIFLLGLIIERSKRAAEPAEPAVPAHPKDGAQEGGDTQR